MHRGAGSRTVRAAGRQAGCCWSAASGAAQRRGAYTELLASRWLQEPPTELLKLLLLRSSCRTTGSAEGRP